MLESRVYGQTLGERIENFCETGERERNELQMRSTIFYPGLSGQASRPPGHAKVKCASELSGRTFRTPKCLVKTRKKK
jgi:hypothetical protein